jgi:hypothetical protein
MDKAVDITVGCRFCGKSFKMTVSLTGFMNFKGGMAAHEALPELKPEERELLISGGCSVCWKEMMGGNRR